MFTAFAPALLTYAFVSYLDQGLTARLFSILAIVVLLVLLCFLVLRASAQQLEKLPFKIESLRVADSEVVGFVIAYMLPFLTTSPADVDLPVVLFVLGIVFLIAWHSKAYHFNPLLGMLGYHFYEVTTPSNVTFLLISRKDLRNAKELKRVVQISEYIVLEAGF